MNKFKLFAPLLLLLAVALSACGGSADSGTSDEILTQAAQIAIDGLTQTAAAAPPTATNTPEPTATNTPEPTPTFTNTPEGGVPTATNTQQAAQPSGNTACLRANLEYETVPDGTEYPVGRVFTKTWRLKNIGSCPWTPAFQVVWVEGELMNANSVYDLTAVQVNTNEYVEIEIAMQAPDNAGTYKGYWMLRSNDGTYFGVGPAGKSWFWVEIKTFVPVD